MNETEANFFFKFSSEDRCTPVYFAMSYPYSYADLQIYLDSLDKSFENSSSIYYKRELLTRSFDGNRIDLLTISSHSQILQKSEQLKAEGLFPEANSEDARAKRYLTSL